MNMKVNNWFEKWEYEKDENENENLRLLYIAQLCKLNEERKELVKNLQSLDYRIEKLSELINPNGG